MAMRELVEIKLSAILDITARLLDCLLKAVTLRDFNGKYRLIGPEERLLVYILIHL
jgi:hypothetical protein